MHEYYIVAFSNKKRDYYCIWTSDEGFITYEDKILLFDTIMKAKLYCHENQMSVDDTEITRFYIDDIFNWCTSVKFDFDCDLLLNWWNILSDVYKSLGIYFDGDSIEKNDLYEKLFFGNNLPTINKSDKKYIPIFSKEEMEVVKKLLIEGVNFLTEQFT